MGGISVRQHFASIAFQVAALFWWSGAQAQTLVHFDLPAQPLAESLKAIGTATNTDVGFSASQVAGFIAPSLKADLTLDDALLRVLAGTGLRPQHLNDHTIVIAPTGSSPLSSAGKKLSPAKASGSAGPPADSPQSTDVIDPSSPLTLAQTVGSAPDNAAKSPIDESQSSTAKLEEVVVTGTHIRGAVQTGSPLITISQEDIEESGYSSMRDLVRSLPQNFGGGLDGNSTFVVNGLGSTSNVDYSTSINLRGLGFGSTLTLLDGHRMVSSGITNAVDISVIPLSIISRIDVLPDGASAVYGSDAVAGVVNIVLKDHVDGAETSVDYGTATAGGSATRQVSQSFGQNWNSGNILLAYELFDQNRLLAANRSFSSNVPGPTDLQPEQQRNSYFLHAKQSLFANTSGFIDALYSADHVTNVTSANPPEQLTDDLHKSTTSVVGGLDLTWSGDWHAGLLYNFGQNKTADQADFLSFTLLQDTNYRNQVDEIDAQIDGSPLRLPGGDLSVAIGAEGRKELFDTDLFTGSAQSFDRRVTSGYVEANAPLLGPQSAIGALSVDAATRFEHYSDFGSFTNPKLGVSWSLTPGWTVRSSWGKAFQAPTLYELHSPTYADTQEVTDPESPTGKSLALTVDGGNPDLRPQTARTLTLGVDWKSQQKPDLTASITYFNTRFSQQIGVVASSFNSYLPNEAYDSVAIVRNPSLAYLQSVFDAATYTLPSDLAAATVYLNGTYLNLALSRVAGLDLIFSDRETYAIGTFHFSANIAYLLQDDLSATENSPTQSLLDKVFYPNSLKVRGITSWERGAFQSTVAFNYVSRYENNTVSPYAPVGAYFTTNLQLALDLEQLSRNKFSRHARASLGVTNVFDKSPPYVASPQFYGGAPFGYDPANADPLGRFINLQFTKGW